METAKPTAPAVIEKNITDQVLVRINALQSANALKLPENYSAENALKSAYLIMKEVIKDGKSVMETCTKDSVVNTLLDMTVQGLNPMKKQCYFIPYGNKLTLSRSYQGSVAVARRCGLKSINANVIYEADDFTFEVNKSTGRKALVSHEQKIENIDLKKIRGAYAIVVMENGDTDLEVMNIVQIRAAWNQGAAKGNSGAHNNFTDEMCKKTVISRACKNIINSSDDSHLYHEGEEQPDVKQEIESSANKTEIGFDTYEEVKEEPAPVPKEESEPAQNGSIPGF